jgi:branched-subunit amino acid transport protein
MNMWLTIVAAGLLTFLTRLSFIYLVGRRTMPDWFMRALRFVPVAVLSAIIVPETLTWQGATSLAWRNPQLWAAIVAVLVGLRVKNVLLIIAAGMVAFVAFQWLFGLI